MTVKQMQTAMKIQKAFENAENLAELAARYERNGNRYVDTGEPVAPVVRAASDRQKARAEGMMMNFPTKGIRAWFLVRNTAFGG